MQDGLKAAAFALMSIIVFLFSVTATPPSVRRVAVGDTSPTLSEDSDSEPPPFTPAVCEEGRPVLRLHADGEPQPTDMEEEAPPAYEDFSNA